MDAATRKAVPLYVTAFESMWNLPVSTTAEAAAPNKSGLYPRRSLARNPNTTSVRIRKPIVSGKRYAVEIRNPSPSEETIPV
jgi:hypothetical protein